MQIVCNELDSKRCDPDSSTYSFLSILFCICPIPFYFIKSLYIFHTSSLLLFFVLFPFDLLYLGLLFFSFLLCFFFQHFSFLSHVFFFPPVWLFTSVCPFSFFVAALLCHFLFFFFSLSRRLLFSFVISLFYYSYWVTVTRYSLVGGYRRFERTCNLLLLNVLKILVAIYSWRLIMYPPTRRHIP